MLVRFEGSHVILNGTLVELPLSKSMTHDPQQQNPITAGFGSCKNCSCPGYKRGRDNFCSECGHHFNLHR